MNLLKKQLAPITDESWEEIYETSKDIFNEDLSVRKIADVDGPKGLDMGAVPVGRLSVPKGQKSDEILYGIQQVQPLIEVRSTFELDLWELDNVNRGAQDVDLEPLEKAAKRLAAFEERTAYEGLKNANIKGLMGSTEHNSLKYPDKPNLVPQVVAEAVTKLKTSSVEGPYTLLMDTQKWEMIASYVNGYPLRMQLEKILGGSLIFAPNLKGAVVVSERGGDFKLTLGQDISIGYESHDRNKVQLYFTEAFTFQVLDPAAAIVIK